MKRESRLDAAGWLLLAAVVVVAAYLGRRRGRLLLAAISGAVTDRALRALADVFRDEEA